VSGIKKEKQLPTSAAMSDQEAFENMELLSQLNEMNLEAISSTTNRIKQEANSLIDSLSSLAASSTTDFVDMKQLSASHQDKLAFFWLDAFEGISIF
jgi:hypothetical protein